MTTKQLKGGTLFSGGGGFCLGMVAVGIDHAWGVEYDDRIAQVARDNGLNTITADILQCDPADFEPVDFLHASPPCPNFSNAKANAEETDNDRALAAKVCEFITELLPPIFTLENVYQYRKSRSWQRIAKTLLVNGYQFNYWHVNFADYGSLVRCPIHHALELTQNSALGAEKILNLVSRMKTAPDIVQLSAKMQAGAQAKILAWDVVAELAQITLQDIVENAPPPEMVAHLLKTKLENLTTIGRAENGLMNEVMSGLGVTENILENIELSLKRSSEGSSVSERLFTTSTETQQITAQKILECLLTMANIPHTITRKQISQMDGGRGTRGNSCPLCELKGIPQTRKRMIAIARRDGITPMLPPATHSETPVNGLFERRAQWVGWYEAIEDLIPALPDSEFAPWQLERLPDELTESLCYLNPNVNTHGDGYRVANLPATTIPATRNESTARAFILDGQNAGRDLTILDGGDSMCTLGANGKAAYRAFVTSNQRSETKDGMIPVNKMGNEPVTTIRTQSHGGIASGFVNGRVVKMTVHALARFQSFPDSYRWPESNALATRIIGNAVPPLFAQRLCEWLI